MTCAFWLGVASKDHVLVGVREGFAQVCHGRRGPLAKMNPGDAIVYYSPTEKYGEPGPLRSFTALGHMLDDHIEQVNMAPGFAPWRRAVHYESPIADVAVATLRNDLQLTSQPNWGYSLRRGLIELSEIDYEVIAAAMAAQP